MNFSTVGVMALAMLLAAQALAQKPAPDQTPPATVAAQPADRTIPAAAAEPAARSGELTKGAASVVEVLASLARFDQDGRNAAQKVGFELPQSAINDYLAYALRQRPRPGISSVKIALLPNNEVAAMVEIDFDAVQKWNSELLPPPLRPILSGKQTVRANISFSASNGSLTYTVKEMFAPDGKPIQKKVVDGLLQALGARQPESYVQGDPIPLPFGLKRVWTERQVLGGNT